MRTGGTRYDLGGWTLPPEPRLMRSRGGLGAALTIATAVGVMGVLANVPRAPERAGVISTTVLPAVRSGVVLDRCSLGLGERPLARIAVTNAGAARVRAVTVRWIYFGAGDERLAQRDVRFALDGFVEGRSREAASTAAGPAGIEPSRIRRVSCRIEAASS